MSNPINLNTATEEELVELPGIAKGLAARIVQYREKVHPFEEVIELASVPGISERMVRELKGMVSITTNGNGNGSNGHVQVMEKSAPAVPTVVVDSAVEAADDAEEVDDAVEVVETIETEAADIDEEVEAESDSADEIISESVDDGVPLLEVDVDADMPSYDTEEDAEATPIAATAISEIADADTEVNSDVEESIDRIPEVVRVSSDEPSAPTPRPAAAPAFASSSPAVSAPAESGGIDWLSALVGALIGVALSMLLFWALFLRPAQNNQNQLLEALSTNEQRVTQIESSLSGNIETVGANVDALASDTDGRLTGITDQIEVINTDYDAINNSISAIDGQIETVENAITSLEETSAALAEVDADLMATDEVLTEQIVALDEITGVFDGFLFDLRDLLVNIKGAPEVETPALEEDGEDAGAVDTGADADEADSEENSEDAEESDADAEENVEEDAEAESDAETVINSTPAPEPSPTPITVEVPDSED